MFVDAQDLRAARRMPFPKLALEMLPEVAFDGSGADLLATSQSAAVDAVEVVLVDDLLVCLAGPLVRQNAPQTLAEVAATAAAVPFRNLQFQDAGSLPQFSWRTVRRWLPLFLREVELQCGQMTDPE